MREAIAEEDADFVRQLLAYGADPTAFGYVEQITRLSDERNDLLEMLIEAGASVNGVDGSSRPVYVAATSGRLSQTRRLLDAGANPDVMSDNGKPLLILLPLLLEPEVYYPLVDLLLDAGADPTLRDKDGRAPLSVAAARGDYELALRLKQADTAGARRELAFALAKSVSSRDAEAVALLLGLGAHPGGMNADGMSLIEEAARRGALDVVETLLEGGASPNVSVPSGFGLVPAADIGQSAWRYPADRKSPREPLPLVTAALLAGNHDVMKRLIRYDVDVNRVTPSGLTPLLALSSARPGTVKVGAAAALLVQAGADLTAADGEGYTVLTRAAEQDRVNLLVALSEAGADLNVPDQRGRQVVEILSQRTYQTAAFGELLDLGLEPTDTATSLAKSRRAKNIVRLLERESG
jgi:ankyrin repeat protein